MKSILRNSGLLLLLIIGFCSATNAQSQRKADNDTRDWRYEIEAIGVGTQGTYLIRVWSYSKKPAVAIEQAKKNAVHGVIFKGFSGTQGVPGQKALTNNANLVEEKAEFFTPFFADGGKYMKFVGVTNDGAVDASNRLKVGKEYKIGVIVSVNVTALRQDLEAAGMIRGLNSGF
jgi:hypothetical protein